MAATSSFRGLKPGPGRSSAEVTLHQRTRIDRAIVEMVAEHGYGRTTVREIARVAGVSTRAFYQHYSGKEECFLQVHRFHSHRILRRVGAVADTENLDDRLRAMVEVILDAWKGDWQVARFLLLGPYGAGRAALKQARIADRLLGEELRQCLGHFEGSTGLIAAGLASGLAAAVRSAMACDRNGRSSDFNELTKWVLSCSSPLPSLRASSVQTEWRTTLSRTTQLSGAENPATPGGDVALMQVAISKLAAAGKYDLLVPRDICAAAGVSQRSFNLHFSNIDDCLVTVASQRFDAAVQHARRVRGSWSNTVDIAFQCVTELCCQIAWDPALASLCFEDLIECGEWTERRDLSLAMSIGRLFEDIGHTLKSLDQLEVEASLGAVLGLLRNEVVAGRTGGIPHLSPTLAYLLLAPFGTEPAVAIAATGNSVKSPIFKDRKHGIKTFV